LSTTSPCLNEKPALVSNAASLAGLDISAELRDVAVRSHGLDRTMVRIPKLCADHGMQRVEKVASNGPALFLGSLRMELCEGEVTEPEEGFTLKGIRVNAVGLKTHDQLLGGSKP
jgi:hypothetical protein